MRGVDIMPIVFWGFIGLCFALIIGVCAYFMWTQPGWRPHWFRSRPNPSVAQMRATKVPASLAALFKVAAGICALLGVAVLAWLATLE